MPVLAVMHETALRHLAGLCWLSGNGDDEFG
jgi:hypothetical protein